MDPARRGAALAVSAAAAIAVVAPFLLLGTPGGHDLRFHLSSWMEVADLWRDGIACPRWAVRANFGFGEPRFVFYPPASWILGAGLSRLLPWDFVPGAFTLIALTVAGLAMHRLASEWLPPREALWAAALYAANPYHMVLAYQRSAFAEMLASALFPLAVRSALAAGRDPARAAASLGLVAGAIWLCNAPAGVVATYAVALLLALVALCESSARPLLAGTAGITLGFGLASFYLLPAAFERRWVNIGEALEWGLSPRDNFLFTITASDPGRTAFNFLVSKVALAEIAATVLAVALAGAARRLRPGLSWPLLGLVVASSALMFRATSALWGLLPELRFVQFPWRWLFPLGAPLALFAAAAVGRRAGWPKGALGIAGLSALALAAYVLAPGVWWRTGHVAAYHRETFERGLGYAGTDEYAARGSNHYYLPFDAPRAAVVEAGGLPAPGEGPGARATLEIEEWGPERKRLRVESARPVTLALRVMNYPAWRAEVDGRPVAIESAEATGQMRVRVPAGTSRLEVRLLRTPDHAWGALVSILSAILLAGTLLLGSRRGAALRAAS